MNKTFKVIFSKARNALMVVNEATGSVQAKGTKTVIATAVTAALMTSGAAVAATVDNSAVQIGGDSGYIINEAAGDTATVEANEDGSLKITVDSFDGTGYGAANNNIGNVVSKIIIADGSSFTNNSTTGSAGALTIFQAGKHESGSTDNLINGSTFKGNTAVRKGGAVATLLESTSSGIEGSTTITNSKFESNKVTGAAGNGGAVYGEHTAYTVKNSKFETNEAGQNGGAIYGEIVNLTIEDSTFDGNKAGKNGGAVFSWSDSNSGSVEEIFSISGSTFTGNEAAAKGGAVAWLQMESKEIGKQFLDVQGSTFDGNKAGTTGGAIQAEGDLAVKASTFTDNESTGHGGAIFVKRSLTVDDSTFSNNTSKKAGGAITFDNYGFRDASHGYVSWTEEDGLTRTITNSEFVKNHADDRGGAIAVLAERDFYAVPTTFDNVSFVENSSEKTGGAIHTEDNISVTHATFTGNTAQNGGALYAELEAQVKVENSSFTNNTAEEAGAAVYVAEDGAVDLNNVTFSNNKVGETFNDIHNDGSVTASGAVSLDGGISGNGTFTVEKDTVLTVIAGKTQISNNVVNQGASLNLTLDKGFDGNYQLITEEGSLDKSFDLVENTLYNITEKKDANGNVIAGEYVVEKRSADGIAARSGANFNQARALLAITEGSTATGNETFDAISDLVNTNIQSANASDRQVALDAVTALSTEAAPVIAQTQTDTATQVYAAVGSRFELTNPQEPGSNLWVQGLFSTGDYDDNGTAKGYDTDSNGIAFGLDSAVTDSVKVGVGFAYTDTDIDGFLRDTDVESKTAFIYGQYKPSKWYVNGIMSYGWSSYDESKHVAGFNVGADYDVETFGLQAMTGYDFEVAGVNVTPEAGLRYFRISQDGYTDGAGSTVGSEDNDVLTAVVGAKVDKTFEVSPAVVIKPQARLAITYDMIDADNNAMITLANGATYRVNGETMDRFGVEVDVGVAAEVTDNFEFALTYSGNFRGDFQNHAGLINAKYKF